MWPKRTLRLLFLSHVSPLYLSVLGAISVTEQFSLPPSVECTLLAWLIVRMPSGLSAWERLPWRTGLVILLLANPPPPTEAFKLAGSSVLQPKMSWRRCAILLLPTLNARGGENHLLQSWYRLVCVHTCWDLQQSHKMMYDAVFAINSAVI